MVNPWATRPLSVDFFLGGWVGASVVKNYFKNAFPPYDFCYLSIYILT